MFIPFFFARCEDRHGGLSLRLMGLSGLTTDRLGLGVSDLLPFRLLPLTPFGVGLVGLATDY